MSIPRTRLIAAIGEAMEPQEREKAWENPESSFVLALVHREAQRECQFCKGMGHSVDNCATVAKFHTRWGRSDEAILAIRSCFEQEYAR